MRAMFVISRRLCIRPLKTFIGMPRTASVATSNAPPGPVRRASTSALVGMGVIQSPAMGKTAVHVKLTAAEGKGDDVVTAFSTLYEGPLDAESGCEVHVIHQAKDNPDLILFYEVYSDEEAYKAHGQGEALRSVFPKLAGLLSGAPEVTVSGPKHAKGIAV